MGASNGGSRSWGTWSTTAGPLVGSPSGYGTNPGPVRSPTEARLEGPKRTSTTYPATHKNALSPARFRTDRNRWVAHAARPHGDEYQEVTRNQ
jgi:hypothetical protein